MKFNSKNTLMWIWIGVIAGLLSGWFFGKSMLSVVWIGDIFLNALKMMVVPLVVTSMICGMTGMGDIRQLGKIGKNTILYYTFTTAMAVLTGIIVVNIMSPGIGVATEGAMVLDKVQAKAAEGFAITNVIVSMISPNIVQSAANTDILPLIIFSLVFGGILSTMQERGKPVVDFFNSANEVIMKFVHLIIAFAPIGIFALIAGRFGQAGGSEEFAAELLKVGKYFITVLAGLGIHAVLTLPLILIFIAKRNPLVYLRKMSESLLSAFSTASSSATLPVTIECVEEKCKVPKRISSFVLPLGATINMDGTALYESVAAIFIAQAYGLDLSMTDQVMIFLTATLASIGAAGIPEAGLVTMVIVLNAVGLPLEGISLIVTVDWLLDRFRTTINVFGDSIGCAVIEQILLKEKKS